MLNFNSILRETPQIQPSTCVKGTNGFFQGLSKPDVIPEAHFSQLV